MAPGLRIGYLVTPPGQQARFLDAAWASIVMVSPLTAELASRWIRDGTAAVLASERREEARARQELARQMLAAHDFDHFPTAPHIWLRLPEGWGSACFVTRASQRGIALIPGDSFSVGKWQGPPAVRVALGCALHRDVLRRALGTLDDILRSSSGGPRVV